MPESIAVPGKLMLAGEYAVLRPHGLALAVAVSEIVRTRQTDAAPGVELRAFGKHFHVDPLAATADGLAGYVARALDWLRARGIGLETGVLMDVSGAIGGHKVGLGTSAAVTVATLRVALAAAGQAWRSAELAAAAREIHGAGQGAGSGYDVTAIAHGGCIAYERSPDRARALAWPAGLHMAALFSGAPAPTQAALHREGLTAPQLDAIDQAARGLLAAWNGPVAGVLEALRACDTAFLRAAAGDAALVPAEILAVRDHITSHGCVARASGAGGGDCVLACSDEADAIARLCADWQAGGGHVVARMPQDLAPELP